MKRVVWTLLLCAALLCGCSGHAAPAEAPAPALQTGAVMGRSYVPEGQLPREVTPMEQGLSLTEQGAIWRAAESPDGRAALYRLNRDTVLVEWDGSVAMFDGWDFESPQAVDPWMAVLDVKSTGTADTLVVDLYQGGGTGASVEELHLLTRDQRGNITDYPLPRELYTEELARQIVSDKKSLTLGAVTLTLPEPEKGVSYTGNAGLGNYAHYSAGVSGTLQLELRLVMEQTGSAEPIPVGRLLADIHLDGDTGVYTLENITIGGY